MKTRNGKVQAFGARCALVALLAVAGAASVSCVAEARDWRSITNQAVQAGVGALQRAAAAKRARERQLQENGNYQQPNNNNDTPGNNAQPAPSYQPPPSYQTPDPPAQPAYTPGQAVRLHTYSRRPSPPPSNEEATPYIPPVHRPRPPYHRAYEQNQFEERDNIPSPAVHNRTPHISEHNRPRIVRERETVVHVNDASTKPKAKVTSFDAGWVMQILPRLNQT